MNVKMGYIRSKPWSPGQVLGNIVYALNFKATLSSSRFEASHNVYLDDI